MTQTQTNEQNDVALDPKEAYLRATEKPTLRQVKEIMLFSKALKC
jgi:hypothetical protein